jgi:serine phosphatase RsbU (regulator of sigma subunit)/ligand-binding sensor domain-containing protein
MHFSLLYVLAWLLMCPAFAFAQDVNNAGANLTDDAQLAASDEYAEEGAPFVRYFPSTEYGHHYQNWWVTQDHRGLMYFANNDGILEYNGSRWRLIPTTTMVKSLDVNVHGQVFVGAQGDFGYLAPDSIGKMEFVSIVPEAIAEEGFADVWNTFCVKDEVYFLTLNSIYRYKDGETTVFADSIQLRAHLGFKVRDEVYLIVNDEGLFKIEGDEIVLVENGDFFSDKSIFAMLPYPDDKMLIGTGRDGLFLWDGLGFMPFRSEVNDIAKREKIYHGVALPGDRFALALANRGGTIIFNKFGILETVINRSTGVRKENATCLFVDKDQRLWLSLLNGIAVADISSPFSHFNENNGVESTVLNIKRHKDDLFIGTRLGLYKLETSLDPMRVASFKKYNELYTWAMLDEGKSMLLGGRGVFEMEDSAITSTITPGRLFTLKNSTLQDNVVYGGFINGLKVLERDSEGKWHPSGFVSGINEEIRSILQDKNGTIWLGTDYQGVISVQIDASTQDTIVKKYDEGDGLPSEQVYVVSIQGETYFTTSQGLYKFSEVDHHFLSAPAAMGNYFANEETLLYSLFEHENGDVYTILNEEAGVARLQPDSSFIWDTKPFKQLRQFSPTKIIPGTRGVLWLVVNDGLIRYNSNKKFEINPEFPTTITSIYLNSDSLVFGGTFQDGDKILVNQPKSAEPEYTYGDHNIRFEYAALSYDIFSHNIFQYKLDNFDSDWSAWTAESSKEYTNLAEGHYTFRVRSENVHGIEGSEAVFRFRIAAPWYRSIAAYVLYLLLLTLLVYVIARIYSRQLVRKNLLLAQRVEERTMELEIKTESLERQRLETEGQKLTIERKNKNITDSIKYAQRIQEAILPMHDDIQRVFKEHFIFYKPRDIVSGDFYWFSPVYGKAMIAACDCTGHGVPGAFMAMMGNDLLNQIIIDNKVTSPSIALTVLDQKVQEALNRGNQTEQQDGMDIALCAFDMEALTVDFAGAYRPLLIVREDTVMEYKSTKRSIGSEFSRDKPFTEEQIELEAGDCIYLFTDGYVDQYGGDEDKKFLLRQFKELILKINHLPMSEQQIQIEQCFTSWMGSSEQLDDILVIGIRV